MKRFILIFTLFLLISFLDQTLAQSNYTISDIVIKGNQKISNDEILKIIDLKVGASVSDEKIEQIKTKLEDTTYFISININKISKKEGIVLEINLVESPFLIFVTGIKLQGLQKITPKDIQRILMIPSLGWTTDQIVWEQRRKFMLTGYFEDVTVNEEKNDSGVVLIFSFKENPILERITVNGLKRISKEKILEISGLKEGMLASEEFINSKREKLENSDLFSNVTFLIDKKEDKLFLTINVVENPIISEIILSGLKKVGVEDVKKILDVKGETKNSTIYPDTTIFYSSGVKNSWEGKLENSGYFKSFVLNEDLDKDNKVKIEVKLEENPWIANIKVNGLKNVSQERFFKILSPEKNAFLSEKYIQEKTKILIDSGLFSNVDVKYRISKGNFAYLTFDVVENPILKSLDFVGSSHVSMKELEKYLILKVGDFVSEDKISEQISKFESAGYFSEVNVDKKVEDDEISLIFIFQENPIINKITFTGISGISFEDLKRVLLSKEGTPFNPNLLKQDLINLQKFVQNRGLVFTTLQEFNFTKDGEIIFVFKEYKVEDIEVEILPTTETSSLSFMSFLRKPTDENVVRREITLKVGENFNWEKVKDDLQRIYNAGIFEDVSIRFEQGSSEDKVKVVYVAKEKLSGAINFGGGYATDTGLYGYVEYKEGNFMGKAQQLSLKVSLTAQGKVNYQLSFYDPWFLGGRNSSQFELYDKNTTTTSIEDGSTIIIEEERAGGTFSFSYPLTKIWNLSLGFKYEDIYQTYSNSISQTNIASFKLGVWRDNRDFLFNPTQGSRQSLNLEFAGGGSEANFIKYHGETQWHIPVTKRESYLSISEQKERQVLSLRIASGLSQGNLPSSELFTLGGVNSIRGFSDSILKGDSYLLFNLQYRIPLGSGVYGVLFLDSGSAWYANQVSSISDIKLYTGIGLGIRYETIIIPIRLDLGYNFGNDPLDSNTKWRVHFSFGDIF
ncbi:MAG TPA: POTRA domain-containing protein [Dictyoglomaceae bacterium]|nr:POTRA domain-containing protein [Dictyoglomaceae bacterium]